jgi:hypothetical protein
MMRRYYFDLRDAAGLIVDDDGYELPDLAAVQWEAVLSLVDRSRDTSDGIVQLRTDLEIEVRDDAGPVMQMTFKFHPRRSQ